MGESSPPLKLAHSQAQIQPHRSVILQLFDTSQFDSFILMIVAISVSPSSLFSTTCSYLTILDIYDNFSTIIIVTGLYGRQPGYTQQVTSPLILNISLHFAFCIFSLHFLFINASSNPHHLFVFSSIKLTQFLCEHILLIVNDLHDFTM